MKETTHDHARRRKALRKGREKGCSLYIPGRQLMEAGIDPAGPTPFYRTWVRKNRRSVIVSFYLEG